MSIPFLITASLVIAGVLVNMCVLIAIVRILSDGDLFPATLLIALIFMEIGIGLALAQKVGAI